MSTPYNDQWILGRPRWRRRKRAAANGALGHTSDAQPRQLHEPHDTSSASGPHGSETAEQAGTRRAFAGTARKRPRWIDRDT